jgi:hypothetical protein
MDLGASLLAAAKTFLKLPKIAGLREPYKRPSER